MDNSNNQPTADPTPAPTAPTGNDHGSPARWWVALLTMLLLGATSWLPDQWQLIGAVVVFLYVPQVLGWVPAWGSLRQVWDATMAELFAVRHQAAKGLGIALLNMGAVFPLFIAGFYIWQTSIRGLGFDAVMPTPIEVLKQWAINTLVIALSEEVFFRSYLSRLFETDRSGLTTPVKQFWPTRADLWANFFFALAHVVTYQQPVRMIVFFPGLWYASLRRQTGGLVAPVLAHGCSNVLMNTLLGLL